MANLLVDIQELLRTADYHEREGDRVEKETKPPYDWLNQFPEMYGTIAHPIYLALNDHFFPARQREGKRIAELHRHTARALRETARLFQQVDEDNANIMAGLGPGGGLPNTNTPPGSSVPFRPPVAPPNGSPVHGPRGDRPTAVPPAGDLVPVGNHVPPLPVSQPPSTSDALGGNRTAAPESPPTGSPVAPQSPNTTDASTTTTTSALIGTSIGPIPTQFLTSQPTHSGQFDTASMFPLFPYLPQRRQTENDIETTDIVETDTDDLLLARLIVSYVQAAVHKLPGQASISLTWAAAVLRGPQGPAVFLTSNEGRGWLPAGMFLPAGTTVPWAYGIEDPAWEDDSDPARILFQFGQIWGPRNAALLTALASSTDIDERVSAMVTMDGGGIAEKVPPADGGLDLTVPGSGLVDRLTVAGAGGAIGEDLLHVPDDQLAAECLRLAGHAHNLLRADRTEHSSTETETAHAVRERILANMREGLDVPADWFRELWQADVMIAAASVFRGLNLGMSLPDDEQTTDRGGFELVLARRCNELMFLLAGDIDRQTLRDTAYAFGQVAGHPRYRDDLPEMVAPSTVSVHDAPTFDRPDTVVTDILASIDAADPTSEFVPAMPPISATDTAAVPPPPTIPLESELPAAEHTPADHDPTEQPSSSSTNAPPFSPPPVTTVELPAESPPSSSGSTPWGSR